MLSQIREEDYVDMFDDDDSDSESADSSDDNISIVVKSADSNTTQKKIFRKKTKDEDPIADFDKEMENELCETVNALESVRKLTGGSGIFKKSKVTFATEPSQQEQSKNESSVSNTTTAGEGDPRSSGSVVKKDAGAEQYDDIYFDSDDELEKIDSDDIKHPVLSNDDLFYDPEMDTRDQMWMDERRRNPQKFEFLSPQKRKSKSLFQKKSSYNNNENDSQNSSGSDNSKGKKSEKSFINKKRRAPKSDAILDCPACMTTLCIDCQKHATFPNQYRAMFVMNCTIDFTERLRYPHQGTGKKKKRQVSFNDGDADDSSNIIALSDEKEDVYYPVKCDECTTQVAMYDKDEIYHFFNVISSYG